MLTIDPKELSVAQFHSYLLGSVVPRPIAFVSTIDDESHVNLSPFSFFNAFGANPPILVFSPSRRVRDNTQKHTLENVQHQPEAVINIVDHKMAEQMSLSSTEYPRGVNEFIKAGLTMADSEKVKPPRVKESPVSFECKVREVVPLGNKGGSGNMVICEILLAHFADSILDKDQQIDPRKLDVIARLGGNWYARITPEVLFPIVKPLRTMGIGVDKIPETIRNSHILTGNDLGKLGNVEDLSEISELEAFGQSETISKLRELYEDDPEIFEEKLHGLAHEYLTEGRVMDAWKTLLQTASGK